MAWTVRDIEHDRETIDAIEGHDDRSAATMAGSYLEDRLTSTIKAHAEDALRRGATFGQKIGKANRLGIFDDKTTEILHVIREIRNEFAHSLANISFSSPNIVKLCNQLFAIESIRKLRSSHAATFKDSPALLEMNSVLLDPILELPNNPRNTYMNTVKIMLFFYGTLQGISYNG